MALLSVIRRWHFREGMPIREIERRTGLSRNTIRKYLRAGAVEPKFKVPDRPSNLDPFAEKPAAWLRVEAGKSRKQRRTPKQIYTDLVSLGYVGSYGRVAAFVRAWKVERQRDAQTSGRGTFVPLVFAPGEAFQFDWSEDWAVLGGEQSHLPVRRTLEKLGIPRPTFCRWYDRYRTDGPEALEDRRPQPGRVWNRIPDEVRYKVVKLALDEPDLSPRELAVRFTDTEEYFVSEAPQPTGSSRPMTSSPAPHSSL